LFYDTQMKTALKEYKAKLWLRGITQKVNSWTAKSDKKPRFIAQGVSLIALQLALISPWSTSFSGFLILRPRGSTATSTMLWRNSWSIPRQTHEKLMSNLCFSITNCQIVRFRSSTYRNNYKIECLSSYLQWKLANELARIGLLRQLVTWRAFQEHTD